MAEIADQSGVSSRSGSATACSASRGWSRSRCWPGIAARTKRVRLGPACMASFPLRDPVLLAYQWASLDLLAEGRTVLVACTGIVPQEGGRIEGQLYGLDTEDRVERLIEWITLLKRLWTEDNVTFEGEHYRCEGITIEPKPAAKPRPPIWIANNAARVRPTTTDRDRADAPARRQPRRRLGDLALRSGRPALADRRYLREQPASRAATRTRSRPISTTTSTSTRTAQAALDESKRFLDVYYTELRARVRRLLDGGRFPGRVRRPPQVYEEMGSTKSRSASPAGTSSANSTA